MKRLFRYWGRLLLLSLLCVAGLTGCSDGVAQEQPSAALGDIAAPNVGLVMPESLYIWATPDEFEPILAELGGRILFQHGDLIHVRFDHIESFAQLETYRAIIKSSGFRVSFIPLAQLFGSDLAKTNGPEKTPTP